MVVCGRRSCARGFIAWCRGMSPRKCSIRRGVKRKWSREVISVYRVPAGACRCIRRRNSIPPKPEPMTTISISVLQPRSLLLVQVKLSGDGPPLLCRDSPRLEVGDMLDRIAEGWMGGVRQLLGDGLPLEVFHIGPPDCQKAGGGGVLHECRVPLLLRCGDTAGHDAIHIDHEAPVLPAPDPPGEHVCLAQGVVCGSQVSRLGVLFRQVFVNPQQNLVSVLFHMRERA